ELHALVEHEHGQRGQALGGAEDDEHRVRLNGLARPSPRGAAADVEDALAAPVNGHLGAGAQVAPFDTGPEPALDLVQRARMDADALRLDFGVQTPGAAHG